VSAGELPSLGGSLVLSFLSLALVCLLAYLTLRWLSRRGAWRTEGLVRVLARCVLEPRRAVYLLQVAGRCFLVGVGDGPMVVLAEIDPATMKNDVRDVSTASSDSRFAELLARFRGKEKS